MKYFIYITPKNSERYRDSNGDHKYYKSGWNNFALTKNKGEYHEEGYFCGAASYYGFGNCEVIGETETQYSFTEDEKQVYCNCKYVIKRVNRLGEVEDGCAWRNDNNFNPFSFEAVTDDQAFDYFETWTKEHIEDTSL